MYKYILSAMCCVLILDVSAQNIFSPDKSINVLFRVKAGKPVYTVRYHKQVVIAESALGLGLNNANLYSDIKQKNASEVSLVNDRYTMLNAKKNTISYRANKRVFTLLTKENRPFQVIFQVSNDGVAFRYHLPGKPAPRTVINKEYTTYNLAANTKAWLQPKAEAQSGWEHTNPSYEEYYQQNIPAGTFSRTGWVCPALFKTGKTWMLITEAGMDGSYCGTTLYNDSASTSYGIGFPDKREVFTDKGVLPVQVAYTPWRIVTIGSLKTIVESTLGTDLAIPAIKLKDISFIKPGKASWSWIMSKDDSITYAESIRYIDLAAKMNWHYCLIDVNWDTKIGYDKIKQLADYGAKKNVGLLLWYNSAGAWNTVKYQPKDKLLTHEDREKEFARL